MKLDCYINKVAEAEETAEALIKLLNDANIENGANNTKDLQQWLNGYVSALLYIQDTNTQGAYLEV